MGFVLGEVTQGEEHMTQCKHRWLLTPVPDSNHYRYQCAKCNETAWATLKEQQE